MEINIRTFANLAIGILLLWVAWSSYSYYSGREKLSEEKEKRRRMIKEKHKVPFLIAIAVSFFAGLGIIFNTLFR